VRWRKHPEPIVTFNIGRNINYTNICCAQCRFCAFHRKPGDPEGYVLTTEEILAKIDELVKAGGREVLLQGGLNPYLKIDYFENLFRTIKQHYDVDLHALSSSEINYLARTSGLSVEETLVRLRSAGLDTIPGAAEMLVDEVRRQIAPCKETTQEWLNLMRTAHKLGIRTTATMMYGSLDTPPQRIEHLLRVRELQDETGGFTAFIPWNFQPDGTRLQEVLTNQQGLIERQNFLSVNKTSSFEYLRTVAVSRLMLDNIDNIQASWVTQGPKIAQISLRYGVNDFGSTMMEENVVRAAGTIFLMPIEEIRRLIIDAGYTPRIRDTLYRLLD
jgi:cyclic dehypoxanthinyl futalosine synthase